MIFMLTLKVLKKKRKMTMKSRNGFVSNSSSSSFIIDKYYLSEYQIKMIKEYHSESQKMVEQELARWDDDFDGEEYSDEYDYYMELPNFDYLCSDWQIKETDDSVIGQCIIDNFNMMEYLKAIGVPVKYVKGK